MTQHHFKELPKMHTTYANVIKSLIPHGDNHANGLPESIYTVDKLMIDQSNLRDYRKICGFMDDGRVPATYFAVLSQTLQMNMMAKEDFPFAMLGLIHVANSVTQYRPSFDTESTKMTVRLDNLRPHDKGQQFDFVTEVSIDDEVVWQGISTYLSRQKKSKEQRDTKRDKPKTSVSDKPIIGEYTTTEILDVPEDIGRRYAFISGDFNLIHLHTLSAKAFGFPKAIAHGMWSKACCLAKMANLPKAYRVDVVFKLPIFLPSKVDFMVDDKDGGKTFGLYTQNSEKVHLIGEVSYL